MQEHEVNLPAHDYNSFFKLMDESVQNLCKVEENRILSDFKDGSGKSIMGIQTKTQKKQLGGKCRELLEILLESAKVCLPRKNKRYLDAMLQKSREEQTFPTALITSSYWV